MSPNSHLSALPADCRDLARVRTLLEHAWLRGPGGAGMLASLVSVVDQSPQALFGAELRALRLREGWSLRELGAQMHRAFGALADYENGVRMPRAHVIAEYEQVFGLAPGALAERRRSLLDYGSAVCPYMGLEAFSTEDARWFFGREEQADAAVDQLANGRFLAVVGASGSGKSSFVHAGLLARLPAHLVLSLTPGANPRDALLGELERARLGGGAEV